jgi:hypothetical protein
VVSNRHFRVYARHPIALDAALRRSITGDSHEAHLVNLGLGGACLELAVAVPVGDPVELFVTAPYRWDPVVVPGEVAWKSDAPDVLRIGIRFRHRGGSSIRALVEILERSGYD